ncbi:hypothetical protein I6N95_23835 [Vagococcus sp. BWB3-3]|uniref:Uncharacterized protein n=1 Tax=Vagococcus allomyrinae TaxID=2794353 RepID=A0A940PAI6_9ENTE|nr:hypothetical protein [Vagococcus allomyrinae]MBP1044045.1 hypothetical protein [Vagococcus allomyrinae]
MAQEQTILANVMKVIEAYKKGQLGGEKMPEDENPGYPLDSQENYLYFTLPMALNYQRNSYKLWESANRSANNPEVSEIFTPQRVIEMTEESLRDKLIKYQVALQPNKQPLIWRKLCTTFQDRYAGDVRLLFQKNHYSVNEIKADMLSHKQDFPYLSGNKIMNYWLYVMTEYTDLELVDRHHISVAPDTHVIQASLRLGLINETEFNRSDVQQIVAVRWEALLQGSGYDPIDVHTPLWLWGRSNFRYVD